MRVSDIIYKTELDQAEIQFVVEQYIYALKGVHVTIDIAPKGHIDAWSTLVFQGQMTKLLSVYDVAVKWFTNQLNQKSS